MADRCRPSLRPPAPSEAPGLGREALDGGHPRDVHIGGGSDVSPASGITGRAWPPSPRHGWTNVLRAADPCVRAVAVGYGEESEDSPTREVPDARRPRNRRRRCACRRLGPPAPATAGCDRTYSTRWAPGGC